MKFLRSIGAQASELGVFKLFKFVSKDHLGLKWTHIYSHGGNDLFPRWECWVPTVGMLDSHRGNVSQSPLFLFF